MNKEITLSLIALVGTLSAAEFHVSPTGNNGNDGAAAKPLKTIQTAADKAQPGDTITVRAGVYRERVIPPRGGTSDACRITYQAAPGEKVTITGSDTFKTWEKVSGDVWKLTLPNSYFGDFNPYFQKVHGDWYSGNGRAHSRGNVYLNGHWLAEAPNLNAAMKSTAANPMWFAEVEGAATVAPLFLMNIASYKIGSGAAVPAVKTTDKSGTQNATCSEGGECVGNINQGCWLRYDGVDFGAGTESVEIRAAAAPNAGGIIELRDGHFDGPLLGSCKVEATGGEQVWRSFTAKITKSSGKKNLYLMVKAQDSGAAAGNKKIEVGKTTIHACFPGVNPNDGAVEVCIRSTVFTPEKTNLDYITLRGFDLRNAATNWAPPTAGQIGIVSVYWCKGWIVEDNEISYSRCTGLTLGKYSDQWDNKRGTAEGYCQTIDDAIKKAGWSRAKIGSHLVRNNRIHHCGQAGIVGGFGGAFSRIEGNEIYEIDRQGIWSGAEQGGIKLHGAIDTIISGNHIYRTTCGIWLDWMAQGSRISGNLLHDNTHAWDVFGDILIEADHGPYVVDNNIMLSPRALISCESHGGAYIHNYFGGSVRNVKRAVRNTPIMKPHETDQIAIKAIPTGDTRFINNVFAQGGDVSTWDKTELPMMMAGNAYINGTLPSAIEKEPTTMPETVPQAKLEQKADGWYLSIRQDTRWAGKLLRQLVTSAILGKAQIVDMAFENPDGTPIKFDTDYFSKPRTAANPFPGPFETVKEGTQEIKVWPK